MRRRRCMRSSSRSISSRSSGMSSRSRNGRDSR